MIIIGIIIGFFIGSLSIFFKFKKNILGTKEIHLRRGLISKEFTDSLGSFKVQIEIGEIERTDLKSKIEIINMIIVNTKHDDVVTRRLISNMVNNSWIRSDDIEWIVPMKSDVREDKINKILN